ncbi:hypothetical protein C2G38_1639744 [Gigaspora rosea]|uniref:Uncharacterized protein n=1 Tax=Gigaspora rosea TaxID=44941 RepID=A0A397UWY3_9GLOM|nr:hypothetical protein C2G38_1639744 [Gigaspora rosea]
MAEANERINQFQDYQTKLSELLSMNPFIKELEEQAKTIEHLRQRIDQLESSNINQSNLYSYSNYRPSINNPFDSTDNNDLKDELKSLRERVFELETDLLIQKKDSQTQQNEIELLKNENDEIKQQISNILEMVSNHQSPFQLSPLKEFTKPTIEEISEKELHLNEPINSDDEIYVKSSRVHLKPRRNHVTRDTRDIQIPMSSYDTRDIQIPMSSYNSDKTKDMSVSTKSSPLTPTSPTSPTSPTLNPYIERRFETLPERLKPGFHNNSQYIPNQIHKHSRSSETHSSQTQPIQINFSNTPVSPKRHHYFTSNNSSVSSQSGNNYLSDDDSEDNKYVGEQNITEHSSNIDQSREEFVTSHDDLCKCNKCVAAQMREIEFYRSKMRANR